jgi:hypothetical protein
MLQNQPDEFPTRYDLYYFKWNADKIGGSLYKRIQYALNIEFITDQETENFYYYLMINRIEAIGWKCDYDYDILTDYDQPRILTRSKTHILDYRGKQFSQDVILAFFGNTCNDLGTDEYGEDEIINVYIDPSSNGQSLNYIYK